MKKLNLSLVAAIFAMGTFAVAGGDIAPVEPVVEAPVVVQSTGNFYLGAGFAVGTWEWYESDTSETVDIDWNAVMLQAGYNFNKYIAIEGRYWFGLDTSNRNDGKDSDVNVDAWGIYVKPQYSFDAFKVYGLLGYADTPSLEINADGNTVDIADISGIDTGGFSWGIGAAYAFSDNLEVFVDYVSIYDETVYSNVSWKDDWDITTINFGLTYNF